MSAKLKRGFTIIEMVIVIAIIGILAAVLVPTYRNVVDRANAGSALQTARASLNEWLSVATGRAGVPVAGDDAHGNYLSPVYFLAKQGTGVYQFRYNEGTVERTDNDAEKYMDFSALDQVEVYLTTPLEDPGFDPERYSAVIFRQEVQCRPDCPHRDEHSPGDTYSNFYLLRRADSAYALGGADVIALISGEQKFWVAAGMEYFKDVTGGFYQDPTASDLIRVRGLTDSVERSVSLTQYECRTFGDWNTSRYLVTFVKNAADASFTAGFSADSHIGVNASTMPTAAEISREGYTLVGWNTKADGSGTQYAPGAVAETHEETAFYAMWKAINAPTPEKLTFTLLGDGTGYSVRAASHTITGEVVIPATYEGLPVKEVEDNAFMVCESLTSVTIPDSVTSIGRFAFEDCSGLTNVTIGNGVTSIGDYAFNECSSLTSITIGNSVTSISLGAFSDCSSLTGITIPDSVTSIGDYAFSGCSGLTSITIPDNVSSIGGGVFYRCSSLTGITVSPDNSAYKLLDGVLYTKDGKTLVSYLGEKSGAFVIPDGVTSIGDGAFRGFSSLTGITIPDGVTSIGDVAFGSCSSLTSVTIPDSVTSIGDSAFEVCSSLTSVTIPDSVTSIGSGAFFGCSGLTGITIPDGVTSIGEMTFYGCSSLTSITIPDGVTSIGRSAFNCCSELTSVTIPDSVNSISIGAFTACTNLGSINFSGAKSQWNAITIAERWRDDSPLTTIHCTDGDITLS